MISLLVLWSCGGEVENKSANSSLQPLQQQIETQLEKEKQEKKELNITESVKQDILSPSPLETQKTVQKAGITVTLHELVEAHQYIFEGNSREQAAIRVGVLLCDVIVSIEHASKEEIINVCIK